MSVPVAKQKRYAKLRQEGWNRRAACREVGVSERWAFDFDKGHPDCGEGYKQANRERDIPDPIPLDRLSPEAAHALYCDECFATRYLGVTLSPFQVELAALLEDLYVSPDREYAVVNAPPGGGKTTVLHLKACQWTARDRSLRGLFISRSQSLATRNLLKVRRTLARVTPAVGAEAPMAKDYGRFKPDGHGDEWTRLAVVVVQMDGSPIEEKEPTWSAFGYDAEYLGNRFTVSLGDDLDSTKSIRNADIVANNRVIYDDELEPRLDEGGLMVNCQQRLGAMDTTAHCLSKMQAADDDEVEPTPQYRHVKYRAHYEGFCRGRESHHRDAPPYDGTPDGGCLLDPKRLSWTDLRKVMNNRQRFAVVYQQEETDPEGVLVPDIWITGGRGNDGVDYVGCEDPERGLCELPKNLAGTKVSVLTADPSPTKYWSIQWWLVVPETQFRYLLDHHRAKLDAPEFFDYDPASRSYAGILDEWQRRSEKLGWPISHWVVEANVAQRWLLRYTWVKQYASTHEVKIVPHETQSNKAHATMGVESIASHYQHGRVRLPRKQGEARLASQKLIDELTHHPDWPTDDAVMAHWFLEWNLPNIWRPRKSTPQKLRVPSWLKGAA